MVIDRFDLQRQFATRQAELDGMAPIEAMGARGLTPTDGVSPTTATRAKRGEALSCGKLTKLFPFMSACPRCRKQRTARLF